MTNEQLVMAEAYDILSMSEPLTIAQLQRRLTHKVSRAELEQMLRRTVHEQEGVAKGYQPGTFTQVDGKWTVKQLGLSKDSKFTTKDLIARII